MISLNWLPGTAFLFILIFARVGTLLMLLPALGEQVIPARMRLTFALAFSLVLYPLISPSLPAMPTVQGWQERRTFATNTRVQVSGEGVERCR